MLTRYHLITTGDTPGEKCVSADPQDLINVLQEEIRNVAIKARVETATKFLEAIRDLGMTAKIIEDGYLVAEVSLNSDGVVCLSNVNSDYPELYDLRTVQFLITTLDSYGYTLRMDI